MNKIYKILVIDDDDIFLEIAKFHLLVKLDISVEVSTAINLAEIKDKMKEDYDLVLIDLNMPEISGWQVIEKFKDKFKQSSCSVFICTSSIDPRDHKRAADMKGIINEMMSKPINIELVKKYLTTEAK